MLALGAAACAHSASRVVSMSGYCGGVNGPTG
jgi:hypothetical protein